jgi:hypothetical protein
MNLDELLVEMLAELLDDVLDEEQYIYKCMIFIYKGIMFYLLQFMGE